MYAVVWIGLWITQRSFEYKAINQSADDSRERSDVTRYTLISSNALELIMELCLYGWLIRVSFILKQFLKSFDTAHMSEE